RNTHDVIQAVLLRPMADGKYELVVGERRYRASLIARKKTIPATIRELNDEQVQEIQVIENLQRENPHPMAEALGIQKLLGVTHTKNRIEEIAHRLGKSHTYVYQRLKLCDLVESFREMFFGNAINTTQAIRIARLDTQSQEKFYESHCSDWRDEGWYMDDFNELILNFQLNLDRAPFNIKDAKLDKKAGACTKCPHNTAVTTSLFPEESKDARCTNRPCFANKVKLFTLVSIAELLAKHPDLPIAVPDETILTVYFGTDDTLIKGRTILIEEVDFRSFEQMPKYPKKEDFEYNDDEDDNEAEFQSAMEEYNLSLKELQDEVASGNYREAILIEYNELGELVFLHPAKERSEQGSSYSATIEKSEFKAKDYQEAVKSKTLTLDTINGEKERLQLREKRSRELDEIKLQESFYAALQESEAVKSPEHLTGADDKAVSYFLLYDSLGYYGKKEFMKIIFGEDGEKDWEQQLVEFFFNANDKQVSILIRLAILNKAEAKSPNGLCGEMLRFIVQGTPGIDSLELVNIQRTVTKERENKLEEKIAILDKQAEKLADDKIKQK
ncbi:MAG: ParB/RepB/Spo0J family partition protein, partial [Sediminibacterium sp.]